MEPTTDVSAATPEVDFAALQPGQTIGRYEVVAILGQGGFGITYCARDAQLDREVAIKEYLPTALAVRQAGTTVVPRSTKMAEDFAWGRERFVAEGRTLATLQRAPGIVRVFDFLEANGTAYIVMELVPGETLEGRLKRRGTLTPEEIDKILWPLLDGLEKVHATGFLHRDIKPANILLDSDGNPTLIDFGASRAAMAGRTAAMTAVFTPGYAAAEQMTSAKQGPWTDVYGVSATLYHAITGSAPPSAFDRMLRDAYQPLTALTPPRIHGGFVPGLLIGIDAGLAVRADDRPQSIAGWRPVLGSASAPAVQATVVLGKAAPAQPPMASPVLAPKRRVGLWLGAAAALILVLAGGGYYAAMKPSGPDPAAFEAQRKQAEEEEIKRRVAAEEALRREAEQRERVLRLTNVDRQRVQVALQALGFYRGETGGAFGPNTREGIGNWQKARGYPVTGFLDGTQNQALLREASPAVTRFDEEQRRLEEEKKKAAAAPPSSAAAPAPAAPDGEWQGTLHCANARTGGAEFTIRLAMTVTGGSGTWVRPWTAEQGTHSVSLSFTGKDVTVTRVFEPTNRAGTKLTTTLQATYDGADTVTGSGPEKNNPGRACNISMQRTR